MNVIFLSPHFPPQYQLFCRALRDEGATVLGIGDAPQESLPPELREVLSTYYYVPDMSRYDDMLRAVGYLVHRHGRIDRIDSLNEHWLELEARLRDDFNIPGQRPSDTARNRSKTAMKGVFKAAGIPCSEGERLTSVDHARSLADKYGFPLIFKPDVGVGAANTFKVRNEAELEAALQKPIMGYVVEKFEPGRLVSYDGLTAADGRVVFETSHVFSSGIMEVVQNNLTMHYYSRREIPPLLRELGQKTVAAFGLKGRFFHIEFFETAEGGYHALEVNVRPPGGYTTDMMDYSADVDIYRLWARVQLGRGFDHWQYERKYFVAHAGRRNGSTYQVPHEELVRELGIHLMAHRAMPNALAGAMGDYYYLVRDREEETVLDLIRLIEQHA